MFNNVCINIVIRAGGALKDESVINLYFLIIHLLINFSMEQLNEIP